LNTTPAWTTAHWRGDVLALFAGLALPFAFSPYFFWPASVLSLSVLFCVWCGASWRRAAWRGWLHGLGAFGAGVSWIVHSFQFSHIALPIAVLLTVGFVGFLALYPALVGAVVAALQSRVRRVIVLCCVCPGAWMLGEWLRGWFLSGFTWLQIGYAQIDGPLADVLPLGGVYGTGLAVALFAAAFALLCVRFTWASGAVLAGVTAALVLIVLLGARFGAQSGESAEPLRVALMQGNVPQELKWRPEMRQPTLQRYMAMTSRHLGTDLMIWPETAVPAQRAKMSEFIEQLHDMARAAGSAVMFGIPETEGAPSQVFNTVEMVGTARGLYRKRHLVPFGEFLPFDAILRPITQLLRIPVSNFSSGAAVQPPMIVNGHRLAVFICYEIVFGNEVIAALPEAAMLVTVSNDAWFGDSIGPHQHLQMVRTRARETNRDVLRATNTGITAIIDANGAVQARLPQFEVGALAGLATPRAGATPYVRFGDGPALMCCVVLLLVGVVAGFRRKPVNESVSAR
jgi:apolipoprotein N-acyltransferase